MNQTYQVPKQFTTRLDNNLYVNFTELAEETRIPKSVLIREFIKQGIKVKFADFQLTTIEHIHPQLELEDFKILLRDILKRQNGREIRLLGLSVMLKPENQARQLSFF